MADEKFISKIQTPDGTVYRLVPTANSVNTTKIVNGAVTEDKLSKELQSIIDSASDSTVVKTLTDENLDNVTNQGDYRAGLDNTCINKPDGTSRFFMSVLSEDDNYGLQRLATTTPTGPKIYVRSRYDTSWSRWYELYTEFKPPKVVTTTVYKRYDPKNGSNSLIFELVQHTAKTTTVSGDAITTTNTTEADD